MNNKIRKIAIVVLAFIVIVIGSTVSISYANKVKAREVVQLGNKYLSEGKYTEAIIEFEKAIKIDKRNVDGYLGAATAYVNIENIEKAEEVLNLAINNVPKESEIYIELSDIYFNENKIEESVEVLDKGYDKTKDEQIKDKLNLIAEQLEIVVEGNTISVGRESKVRLIRMSDERTVSVAASWKSENTEIANFKLEKNEEAIGNEQIKDNINEQLEDEIELEIKDENDKYVLIEGVTEGIVIIKANIGSIEKSLEVEVNNRYINKVDIHLNFVGDSNTYAVNIARRGIWKSSDEQDVPTSKVNGVDYTVNQTYLAAGDRSIAAGEREFYGEIICKDQFDENMDITNISVVAEGAASISIIEGNKISGILNDTNDYKIVFNIDGIESYIERKWVTISEYRALNPNNIYIGNTTAVYSSFPTLQQ